MKVKLKFSVHKKAALNGQKKKIYILKNILLFKKYQNENKKIKTKFTFFLFI